MSTEKKTRKRTRHPVNKKQQEGMNIIQCLRDKNLLGAFINDETTFAAWFCFLRAFFGLEPEPEDLELFRQCTGRSTWPETAASEAWLPIGVRGGKSFVIAILAVFFAFFKKHSLSKGEVGYILIVAPTRKQAGIIKNYVSGFLYDHPLLKGHVVRETSEEIELDNRIGISTLASDFRSLRGFTAVACIVDEIAYMNLEGTKPDVEVVRALRTRLVSTGGPLLCIGSPYAKKGELYKVYRKHFGLDGSEILVWQAPSKVMNPTLSERAIETARKEDPEAAKADYDAEFRSDIETFVNREVVEAVVATGRFELPPISEVSYRAFIDPAGGSGQDSMTLAIGHDEGGLGVLDAVREVKPPFSPESVVVDFAQLLKRYHVRTVTGDRFGGEWPRERLKIYGVAYTIAEKSKSDIYRDFLPLLNSGEVELLDNEQLTNQLCNLERRTARGGKDSIDHPPNGHDDLANVVAGVMACKGKIKEAGVWGRSKTEGFSKNRRLDLHRVFPGANSPGDLIAREIDITGGKKSWKE
jgi:hypothetical protein